MEETMYNHGHSSRKRKFYDQLGPFASEGWYEQPKPTQDFNTDIQKKLKKLKLNSSPSVSSQDEDDEPAYTIGNSFTRVYYKRREIPEEHPKLEEEPIPTTQYEDVNCALRDIYFENKAIRQYFHPCNENASPISSPDSGSEFEVEFELDEETRNNVWNYYRNQNEFLNQIWNYRESYRMQE